MTRIDVVDSHIAQRTLFEMRELPVVVDDVDSGH